MNNKFILGYSIVHANVDDLWKILDSMWYHLDTEVILLFDGVKKLSIPFSKDVHTLFHKKEMFEHHCNNTMIKYFMEKTNKDALVVLHEDMLINGFSLLSDLDKLISKEDNIGLIGGRDGFDWDYLNMHSSPFSVSEKSNKIKIGEWKNVKLLNFGPVVYTRKTIEKLGYLDADVYKYAYAEQDYCCRALSKNMNNFVIGMDIIHEKFGNLNKTPPWISKEGNICIKEDLDILKLRWEKCTYLQ